MPTVCGEHCQGKDQAAVDISSCQVLYRGQSPSQQPSPKLPETHSLWKTQKKLTMMDNMFMKICEILIHMHVILDKQGL